MNGKLLYESLRAAVSELSDGQTLTLESGAVYDVWQDACEHLDGYHASNTETREENPTGKHAVAIYLKDKRRIVIDGNGATLLIHGIVTPFLFDGCEDVVLKNLTVDYARHTMNEYTVESLENGESVLRMHRDCLYEVVDGALFFVGERGIDGEPLWRMSPKGEHMLSMYCDPRTEEVRFFGRETGDRFPSLPAIARATDLGQGRVRVTWKDREAKPPVGCVVQTRDVRRGELGGLFQYCRNLRLEDLRIRFMHGFGLLCQYCENVTLRGLDCNPTNGYTIACNADFFHFSGCRGQVLIENCVAAGAHDDFVNVHGTHLRVIEADASRRCMLVRFENPNTWGIRAFCEGDRIELIRWDTLLPYAKRRVIRVEKVNDTDFRLTLDKALPPSVAFGKDAVENLTWTPRLTVRGNRFGPSMGRGILCTTRKKVRIEDNLFYKLGGSVLYVASDCNFWMESGYTTDVLFRRNTLVGCGYGVGRHPAPLIYVKAEVAAQEADPSVHKQLRLLRNRIVGRTDTPWENVLCTVGRVVERKNQFVAQEEVNRESTEEQ